MQPSGLVPREIVPGILWQKADELAYEIKLAGLLAAGHEPNKAAKEAVWAVEADLCRRFVRDCVREALRCRTVREKQALFQTWVGKYGLNRAQSMANAVKNEKLRETVLTW